MAEPEKKGMLSRVIQSAVGKPYFSVKKEIFILAIRAFASILPKAPEYDLCYPNCFILLEIKEKFLQHHKQLGRHQLYEDAWDILIAEYDYDPLKRSCLDWIIEELVEAVLDGRWKPRPIHHPSGAWWKEDRVPGEGDYGLFRGRNFRKFIKPLEKGGE